MSNGSTLTPPHTWSIGLADRQLQLLVGVVAAGFSAWLTIVSTRILVQRTHWARALHLELRAQLHGCRGSQLAILALLSGLGEELLFRAALVPAVGIVGAALTFGVAHLRPQRVFLPWALWAAGMGLVFGGLYALAGHIVAPILAHVAINYENMQYVCNYDPTPLRTPRSSASS